MVGRGGIYGDLHGDGQPVRSQTQAAEIEPALTFWYRNYKGHEGYRRVRPLSLRYGTSEWHQEPQWLMRAYDLVNEKEREFAVRDMSGVIGSPVIEFGMVIQR